MLEGSIGGAWARQLSTVLARMIEHLSDPALGAAPTGRRDVGDGTFYVVSDYETRPADELSAESHRRYCDIQVMLDGVEMMGWAPRRPDLPASPYEADIDTLYYGTGLQLEWRRFSAGSVFIFSPDDIHLPGVLLEAPARVRKVVGKVPWADVVDHWDALSTPRRSAAGDPAVMAGKRL